MRRNEKRHPRPAERLNPRPAPPLLGLQPVEEALPGRLLVLMSRLHRRERGSPDPSRVGETGADEAVRAWPAGHEPG